MPGGRESLTAALIAAAVIGAPLLAGCGARDRSYVQAQPSESSGSWRIEHRVDRVTARRESFASVITWATNTKAGGGTASAELVCSGTRLRVQFEFAHRIGAERNSSIAYRVDDRPGDEVEATFEQDHRTVSVTEPAAVARFVEEVSAGSMLLVRVSSPFAGRTFAEFRIVGAAAAFAPLLERCPLPSASPPRASSAPDASKAK